jgi:hypothetical protein
VTVVVVVMVEGAKEDAALGLGGRLVEYWVWYGFVSLDWRGSESEVRLLEKEERRFVSDKSLRTPLGFWALGDICAAEAGEVGVLKLSFRSLVIVFAVLGAGSSRSPGGVVGCEDKGPPPGVGGSTSDGERRGEDAGGGMSVPSVRE